MMLKIPAVIKKVGGKVLPKNGAPNDINDSKLMQLAEMLIGSAVNGLGPMCSSKQLADEYRNDKKYLDDDSRVESLIKWETSKNFGTGFLTGLGGFITLPITVPAGMVAAWAVQARMVGAIADIYGHSLNEDRVRTMILLCLVGSDMSAVLRNCGAQIGSKVTEKLIEKIPAKLLQQINKAVGFRLVTKSGEKGVINLTKLVPVVGAGVSGVVDAASCIAVGRIAKNQFKK